MDRYSTKNPRAVFDVDGTLISIINDLPNWKVIDLMRHLHSMGWHISVHSGGGKDYAEMWVRRLNLQEFVWETFAKGNPKEYDGFDLSFDDEIVTYATVNIQVKP